MDYYSSGGELIHHGILGQKWGVRRYQNKDGTLTLAGKRRAKQLRKEQYDQNDDQRTLEQYGKEQREKTDRDRARRVAEKEIKKLSSEELKARSDRIKLENEYRDLAYPELNDAKKYRKEGRDMVTKIMRNATENIGTQAVAYFMGKGINAVARSLGADEDVVNPKKGQKDK